jgi:cobalt-zinc-cadmium efflux system membrane fusion protein
MMETNHMKQKPRFAVIPGLARVLVPLVVGIVLGALLYAKFAGTGLPQQSSDAAAAESDKSAHPAAPSDVVQISPESQRDVGIAVESAALRSLESTLSATGIVSEDPGRVAHIRPLARGLVEKIYARLGDRVSAGDPLIEYDNIELGLAVGEFLSAQAELQRSLTDLEVRKKILERSNAMLREGAVAQTTYDLREAEYKDAQAKTAGARATVAKIAEQIRRFGWTDRDLADLPSKQDASGHSISHSIVKAPFSGVVTSFHAAEGELVEPATELLAITDMSSLWVLADIYEKDLSHIRSGKAVRVRVASYPGKVFEGRITYVADVIDPKSRTAKVRCLVQNNSGLLKLEMFATIEIPVLQTSPVLAVPDSSIQQIEGQSVVFVRNSETEFQKREIRTGIQSQGYTEIRSGLKPGESVVSQGSFVLKAAFLRHLIGQKEG